MAVAETFANSGLSVAAYLNQTSWIWVMFAEKFHLFVSSRVNLLDV